MRPPARNRLAAPQQPMYRGRGPGGIYPSRLQGPTQMVTCAVVTDTLVTNTSNCLTDLFAT